MEGGKREKLREREREIRKLHLLFRIISVNFVKLLN